MHSLERRTSSALLEIYDLKRSTPTWLSSSVDNTAWSMSPLIIVYFKAILASMVHIILYPAITFYAARFQFWLKKKGGWKSGTDSKGPEAHGRGKFKKSKVNYALQRSHNHTLHTWSNCTTIDDHWPAASGGGSQASALKQKKRRRGQYFLTIKIRYYVYYNHIMQCFGLNGYKSLFLISLIWKGRKKE